MIETERLILREYTFDDFDALYEIVSDPETMQHYPAPFDEERTRGWITWNLENYEKYGFGLWAVVLKETGEFIGDCGISIQNIDGEMLPEIGYHIHKRYWRKGFGKEAARAARDWVFEHTDFLDIVWIANAFEGIKIAVGLLILDAALTMLKKQRKHGKNVSQT